MLSFHNILLISPQRQPPVAGNPEQVLLGMEEKACRDCGNRAKKECTFGRCRTCCKSRGYDCATHVKSTWIPMSQRRDRKGPTAAASGSSCSGSKKPRKEVSDKKNLTNVPLGLRTSSSHQDASFKEALPGKVRAPVVFRRIRVTAVTNGEAEIAYQATVTISGHVFKGFLYHCGVIDQNNHLPCGSKLHAGKSSDGRTNNKDYHPVGASYE